MNVQVWICDPWESYIRSMVSENERDMFEYQIQTDLEHEAFLARAYAYSQEPGFEYLWTRTEYQEACEAALCPWPHYADEPTEVQRAVINFMRVESSEDQRPLELDHALDLQDVEETMTDVLGPELPRLPTEFFDRIPELMEYL